MAETIHPDFDIPSIQAQGRPITPELQQVFGVFGEVIGILAHESGAIDVTYKDLGALRFTPSTIP